MRRFFVPTLLLIALLSAPALAGETRTLDEEFSLGAGNELSVDLKVGSLHIEAGDTGQVSVHVELECKRGRRCGEMIDEVELISRDTSDGLELRLEVPSSRRGHQLRVHLELSVPRSVSLNVDVGVGEVEILGTEENITVDLGVGEVKVEIPELAVASVKLDAGVGDANLHGAGGGDHGRRGFVGKKISWSEGAGHAEVNIDVGVGEVSVRLN